MDSSFFGIQVSLHCESLVFSYVVEYASDPAILFLNIYASVFNRFVPIILQKHVYNILAKHWEKNPNILKRRHDLTNCDIFIQWGTTHYKT